MFVHGAVLRRDAVATGSVSDGTTTYTPAPSREAHLEAVKEGTVVID